MRTTLDLPDELLKRSKIAAVERGISLKELVGAALVRELGPAPSAPSPRRIRFPIFSSREPGSLDLSGEDLARVEEQEDRRRHAILG